MAGKRNGSLNCRKRFILPRFYGGLLGLEPAGFDTLFLRPNLPAKWDFVEFKKMRALITVLDIQLKHQKSKLSIEIYQKGSKIINLAKGLR
jgi:hypothetical protein